MQKRYLLAPGLTQIPPEVISKMAEPIIHHRDIVEKYGVQGQDQLKGKISDLPLRVCREVRCYYRFSRS